METNNLIIDNAKLVLANDVIDGHLVVENGVITDIASGRSSVTHKMDANGGYVLPGFVEVHTDHMDKCFTPRPRAQWPAWSAMSTHDGIMAAAGVTTVCDAVSVGYVFDDGSRAKNLQRVVDSMMAGEAEGSNRIQHLLHLRCELPNANTFELFEALADIPQLRMVSLMDHTPGQRLFETREQCLSYYKKKFSQTEQSLDSFIEAQNALSAEFSEKNRTAIANLAREKGMVVASHDDAFVEQVDNSLRHGCTMAEFPTTEVAAKLSHENGMCVVMGAPNVVRGGSHSGNVAASHLAALGVLDILSSDYYPSSLVEAVFALAEREDNDMTLSDSVKLISTNPARVLKLDDRGEIAIGKRADVVIAKQFGAQTRVEQTFVVGKRVS